MSGTTITAAAGRSGCPWFARGDNQCAQAIATQAVDTALHPPGRLGSRAWRDVDCAPSGGTATNAAAAIDQLKAKVSGLCRSQGVTYPSTLRRGDFLSRCGERKQRCRFRRRPFDCRTTPRPSRICLAQSGMLGACDAHTIAEPLPAPLTALLAQLGRRERAQSRPSEAPPRQRTARPQSAVASAGTSAVAEAKAA
jgi:hypothetical protein